MTQPQYFNTKPISPVYINSFKELYGKFPVPLPSSATHLEVQRHNHEEDRLTRLFLAFKRGYSEPGPIVNPDGWIEEPFATLEQFMPKGAREASSHLDFALQECLMIDRAYINGIQAAAFKRGQDSSRKDLSDKISG